MAKPLQTYHYAWLSVHPERTEEWLRNMLAEGFQVHHIDGDHANDDTKNLVLIESGDHMMLHNGATRLLFKPQAKLASQRVRPSRLAGKKTLKELRREIAAINSLN